MPGAATARATETAGTVFLHLGNGQRIYGNTPEEVVDMWRTMTGTGTPANQPKGRRKTKMTAERREALRAAGKKGAAVAKKQRAAKEKAAAAGGGH